MTRRYFNSKSAGFLLLCVLALALSGFLVGCGTSSIVTALEAVIAAAEAAVATLGAVGTIPPATVTLLENYLTSVSEATAFASTELASNDSPAVKATKIIQQFAMIAAPILPPGTAQVVVDVIQAVTKAIANFLSQIEAPKTATANLSKLTLSDSDRAKLGKIHERATELEVKVRH